MTLLTNKLYIIGGGGHALSVLEIFKEKSIHVTGYIDLMPSSKISLPFFSEDEFLRNFLNKRNKPKVFLGVGTKRSCNLRAELIKKYKRFSSYPKLSSERAIISDYANIGSGSIVMPGVCVRTNVTVGKHCILNTMATIEHECFLGDNVHIGPGAIICGNVHLGKNVFVGAGAIIFPNIKVREDTTIPAGSVLKHETCI